MNLQLKLVLPIVMLLIAMSSLMHFYWLPNYLERSLQDQLENEHSYVSLLGTTLLPEIINSDLAKLHSTLNSVLKKRAHWHSIKVYDDNKIRLFPINEMTEPDGDNHQLIQYSVGFNNRDIATLYVWVNFQKGTQKIIDDFNHLEKLIISTFVLFSIIALLLQNRWVRRPLKQLTDYASQIANQQYDATIDYSSRDQIGKLIDSLTLMGDQVQEREKTILESKTRYKSAFDNVIDAIVTFNNTTHIESANSASLCLFGYSHEEITGLSFGKLMSDEEGSKYTYLLKKYIETRQGELLGQWVESEAIHKDGHTIPIEFAVKPMLIDDQEYFTVVIRDITERQKVERMKREFISTISHELRTPLTSIRGALSIVLGKNVDALPAKVEKILNTAHRNSERLTVLINNLLDLEKINHKKLDLYIQTYNYSQLIQRAIEDNTESAAANTISLQLDSNINAFTDVQVDENRVLQIISNLISNAVKYSPTNSTVYIQLTQIDDQIRTSVIDSGPGIPEEFKPQVFGRFTQADSSDTRASGGTGLGLTLCKVFIEQMGGHIDFYSTTGSGCEFYFDLPIYREQIVSTLHSTDQHSVLICEDDADVAFVLANSIEQEGMVADIAATARSALRLLNKNHYDLMLLDLALPDGDGLHLIHDIRNADTNSNIPIIVVSGRALEGRQEFSGDAFNVADWLQKPVEHEQLSKAVMAALRNNKKPKILHVEDDLDLIQTSAALFDREMDFDYALTLHQATDKISLQVYDLIIIDIGLPDGSGLDLLDLIPPGVPVVLFSGQEAPAQIAAEVAANFTKAKTSTEQLIKTVKELLQQSANII